MSDLSFSKNLMPDKMPAFESKPVIVTAKRYFESTSVDNLTVPAGHWLVERNETRNVLTDERFRELFRPIGKEGVKEMCAQFVDGKVVEYDPTEPVILRSKEWDYEDAEFEVKRYSAGVDAVMSALGDA